MSPAVTVPDVTGLPFARAFLIGVEAGLAVRGFAPDGQPVDPTSEGLVVEQDPMAGEASKMGKKLKLRVGRPPGDDRALIEPGPRDHTGHGFDDTPLSPSPGKRTDSDEDPKLVPA